MPQSCWRHTSVIGGSLQLFGGSYNRGAESEFRVVEGLICAASWPICFLCTMKGCSRAFQHESHICFSSDVRACAAARGTSCIPQLLDGACNQFCSLKHLLIRQFRNCCLIVKGTEAKLAL